MKTSFKLTAFTLSESLPHPNPTPLQIRVKVFHMQNSQVDYVILAFIFINLRLIWWNSTAESYAFDVYQTFWKGF